ncbi:hypothetical protein HPP92_004891 [Vanilla planifolia]|uniref:Uncharacterized protein n=1 Tax=Vanilla planifolia TaxID=51239 RepID=A0A835RSR8_VANPL|nr:hypothetical protein HPP92_004891 [Vanilla planifolia]
MVEFNGMRFISQSCGNKKLAEKSASQGHWSGELRRCIVQVLNPSEKWKAAQHVRLSPWIKRPIRTRAEKEQGSENGRQRNESLEKLHEARSTKNLQKPRVVLKPEPERTAELKLVAAESRKNNYTEVSFAEDDDEDEENRAIDQNRPLCHEMSRRADTCDARGDIRVKSSTNTIFVGQAKEEWEIKLTLGRAIATRLNTSSNGSSNPFLLRPITNKLRSVQ